MSLFSLKSKRLCKNIKSYKNADYFLIIYWTIIHVVKVK